MTDSNTKTDTAHTSPAPKRNLFRDSVAVVVRPEEFFRSLKAQGAWGFGRPLGFAVAAGILWALVASMSNFLGPYVAEVRWSDAVGLRLGAGLAMTLIYSWPAAFLLHVLALFSGGSGTYKQSFTITAYSMAVLPICALTAPLCALTAPLNSNYLVLVPWTYGFYIASVGVIVLHGSKRKFTFATFAVSAILITALLHFLRNRSLKEYEEQRAAKDTVSSQDSNSGNEAMVRPGNP